MVSIDTALIWGLIALWVGVGFIAYACFSVASAFDRRQERAIRKPRKPRLIDTGRRDDEAA